MTITLDISRCAAVMAQGAVAVHISNVNAESSEMDFVGKLVSQVEKFANEYTNSNGHATSP